MKHWTKVPPSLREGHKWTNPDVDSQNMATFVGRDMNDDACVHGKLACFWYFCCVCIHLHAKGLQFTGLRLIVWYIICGMFSIYTVMDVLCVGLSSQGLFLPIINTLTHLLTSKPGFTGQTIVATRQFQQDFCGLNETALSGCSFNAKLPYATSNGSRNASDQGELHWLTKHNWVIFRGFHYYHSQWGQFVQKWLGNKCFERQSEALCKYSEI